MRKPYKEIPERMTKKIPPEGGERSLTHGFWTFLKVRYFFNLPQCGL